MADVTAKWTLTEDYYQLVWDQGLRHRTKVRRWIIPLGLGLALLGVAELTVFRTGEASTFIGTFLMLAGFVEVGWHFWDKARWFDAMKRSPQFNGTVEMHVTSGRLICSGPTSNSEMTWSGVDGFVRTESGIYLGQGRGLSIFIPITAINEPDGADKLEKLFHASRA